MIRTINYSGFSERLHKNAMKADTPIDGIIELTRHCNLGCAHCYIKDNSRRGELRYNEICRIIDEITSAGCLWLLITGGEPLVREDFYDIYRYAKGKGLIITLFTNGTLVTKDTAVFLKRWPPFSVEVTLYGATRETYEAFTGMEGSYNACMEGIGWLLRYNIPLSLKTMVTTINKDEIPEMRRLAESLGVSFRYDPTLNPGLDGSKAPYDVRITPEEVVEFDRTDGDRTREWKRLYERFNEPASTEYIFNCGAGRGGFHITSEGRLWLCSLVPEPDWDLRNNSFIDGYKLFEGIRKKRIKGKKSCAGCKYIIFCNSCPGISMLEGNRDGEMPVRYYCEVAHRRAEYVKQVVSDP